MASREECLKAYNFIGLQNIKHIPEIDMLKLVDIKRKCLGNNITSDESLLLINALRCNGICDDNDTLFESSEKFRIYFEQIEAYELYNTLNSNCNCNCNCNCNNLYDKIYFLLISTPDNNNFVFKPIIKGRYIFNKLLEDNYIIININNLYNYYNITPTQILLPIDLNINKMNFIIKINNDDWIINELLNWFPND
jgi:hypothetical protein